MSAKGDYYPVGPNMWVSNMCYAADVSIESKLSVLLTPTAPAVASATALINASSIASPVTRITLNPQLQTEAMMGKFGRCLQIVASGAAAITPVIHGYDYLGQGMSESILLNATTPVLGLKAFRRVTHVTIPSNLPGITISLGTRDVFGLPYAYLDAGVDFVDGAKAGAQGTWVTPPLTVQTVNSGDPRGTWAPNTTIPNGSRKYTVMYEPRRNDLYGLRHFFNG